MRVKSSYGLFKGNDCKKYSLVGWFKFWIPVDHVAEPTCYWFFDADALSPSGIHKKFQTRRGKCSKLVQQKTISGGFDEVSNSFMMAPMGIWGPPCLEAPQEFCGRFKEFLRPTIIPQKKALLRPYFRGGLALGVYGVPLNSCEMSFHYVCSFSGYRLVSSSTTGIRTKKLTILIRNNGSVVYREYEILVGR